MLRQETPINAEATTKKWFRNTNRSTRFYSFCDILKTVLNAFTRTYQSVTFLNLLKQSCLHHKTKFKKKSSFYKKRTNHSMLCSKVKTSILTLTLWKMIFGSIDQYWVYFELIRSETKIALTELMIFITIYCFSIL